MPSLVSLTILSAASTTPWRGNAGLRKLPSPPWYSHNNFRAIRTIRLVVHEVDKSEDETTDVALGMDCDFGLISAYIPQHENGTMAFISNGNQNLITLIADEDAI